MTRKIHSTYNEQSSGRVRAVFSYQLGAVPEPQGVGGIDDEPSATHAKTEYQALSDSLVTCFQQVAVVSE